MNQEVKQAWLQALRSGEYKQGNGNLHKGDAFCCLGVLCDIAAKQGIGKWMYEDEPWPATFIETTIDDDITNSDTAVPTTSVLLWSGLSDPNPFVGEHTLAEYNDGSKIYDIRAHTFIEIAALIEEHL